MTMEDKTPEELKELGNNSVKEYKFAEAVLYYSMAIKKDPNNFALYSNRSFGFLKIQQYYFALEDANETIRLNPSWPKGYFRKGEVEFATGYYVDAYESYKKALQLNPDDKSVFEAVTRASKSIIQEKKADETIPWLGAGIGIILGVIIVIADCVFTYKPTHPMLMAFITIIIAMIGYGVAKLYRYYAKSQLTSLLTPPVDLDLVDDTPETTQTEQKPHNRYTKSQARQRYRKGKQ